MTTEKSHTQLLSSRRAGQTLSRAQQGKTAFQPAPCLSAGPDRVPGTQHQCGGSDPLLVQVSSFRCHHLPTQLARQGSKSSGARVAGDKQYTRVPGEGGVQPLLVAPAGRVALVSNRSAREAKRKRK